LVQAAEPKFSGALEIRLLRGLAAASTGIGTSAPIVSAITNHPRTHHKLIFTE
jgi:hypothetical protein